MSDEIKIEVVDGQKTKLEQYTALTDLITTTTSKGSTAKYTKENLETYLSNPYRNSANLRSVNDWFYYSNGIYKNIINAFSNLPTLNYMILPSQKTLKRTSDKAYDIYYDKINAYADSINMKLTTRRILKSVAKYGGYVGYERNEKGEFFIQDLPIDYCRVKYRVGNDWQIEFNFKYFDKFYNKEDIDFAWLVFPKEFKSLYNKYKSDKKSRNPEWQMLDIKYTYCIIADDDEPYFIPLFSGMFQSLLSNEEYKDLAQQDKELSTTKLLVQKVPTDKDGNLQVPLDLIKTLHAELVKVKPKNANALTTPLEITDVAFRNQSQEKEDLLGKAERSVFVDSGFSGAIFADNGGNIGLNINIEAVTANIFVILEKIEDVFSRKFKNVVTSKNYDFRLQFFRTTNLNVDENFDRMYKLLEIGGAIQPIFSLLGFDTETYTTLLQVENDLGIKDLLVVPQSMHTQSGSKDAGRQPKAEKDLKDSGVTTRNRDDNNPKNRKS